MKKLLLAFAFIGFLVTSSFATTSIITSSFDVELCDDDKNCSKKDCKDNKEASTAKKGNKKACSKGTSAQKSCCSKDKSKSCSKGKTKAKKEDTAKK
jgi:hypothetical protein